jgi:hypothetical protein
VKRTIVVVGLLLAAVLLAGCSGAASSSIPTTSGTGSGSGDGTTPKKTLTVAQQNAVDSAKTYLQMGSGFSRKGLIQQLDSSAGEGFPKKVATFAVDYLHVDWNKEAVLSAKTYLQTSSFSCSGLTQQLESSAGEDFTHAQAVFGAKKTGLCG